MLGVLAGISWLVTHQLKGTDHFVNISWEDRSVRQELSFQLSKDEYAAFLGDLRSATGKPWQDASVEADRVLAMLENEKANSMEVTFERPFALGNIKLSAGTYRIVPVPREGSEVFLGFFRGPVESRNLVATAPAETITQSSTGLSVKVEYDPASPEARVIAIRTQSALYRFR